MFVSGGIPFFMKSCVTYLEFYYNTYIFGKLVKMTAGLLGPQYGVLFMLCYMHDTHHYDGANMEYSSVFLLFFLSGTMVTFYYLYF